MGVVIEAPRIGHRRLQRILAGMAEGRMADIVGEAERLGQILVEAERAGDGPADLRDLEAVGQADPIMIAVGRDEDLGLVPQPAERDGVDDPVAVALEGVARAAARPIVLGVTTTRAGQRIRREMSERTPWRASAPGRWSGRSRCGRGRWPTWCWWRRCARCGCWWRRRGCSRCGC
jgi:hypothetical protein